MTPDDAASLATMGPLLAGIAGKRAMTAADRAWAWYLAVTRIETCDRAIKQYAALGISGTPNDREHHAMRDAALQIEAELRP